MKRTFHIKLSPQLRNDSLSLEKRGDTLVVNGKPIDLRHYDPRVSRCEWIIGAPEQSDDGWNLQILLPHGHPAPHATRFPAPIDATDDGPIHLPPYTGPDEDAAALAAEIQGILARVKPAHMVPGKIDIPPRLCLSDLPDGVAFSEVCSPFAKYSEFGAVVADMMAAFSLLELEMARTAADLYGKDALNTIRIALDTIHHDNKKIEFIKKIAEFNRRPDVHQCIQKATEALKPLKEIRHKFAHGIWGEIKVSGGADVPDALMLADPQSRLVADAANVQLLSHASDDTDQILLNIIKGERGSMLSEVDQEFLFQLAYNKQNHPGRVEAFEIVFGSFLGGRDPDIEIWTEADFTNVARATNAALDLWLPVLQQKRRSLDGYMPAGDPAHEI